MTPPAGPRALPQPPHLYELVQALLQAVAQRGVAVQLVRHASLRRAGRAPAPAQPRLRAPAAASLSSKNPEGKRTWKTQRGLTAPHGARRRHRHRVATGSPPGPLRAPRVPRPAPASASPAPAAGAAAARPGSGRLREERGAAAGEGRGGEGRGG